MRASMARATGGGKRWGGGARPPSWKGRTGGGTRGVGVGEALAEGDERLLLEVPNEVGDPRAAGCVVVDLREQPDVVTAWAGRAAGGCHEHLDRFGVVTGNAQRGGVQGFQSVPERLER